MFERTVSFWRRLVGGPRKPAKDATGDERRVWVRHQADLQTTYKQAGSEVPERLPALVRDISVGGLSLSVSRCFSPGDLLTVELPGPGPESSCSALACVVHVQPQADGTWLLGCTFARELTDDDLTPFGARRVPTAPEDQRSWQRYACDVQAHYEVSEDGESGRRPAKVLNISASGVRLLVQEPVDNGALLSVHLQPPAGGPGKTMLSCVVHVAGEPAGGWALGCNFITELSESELLALL